MVFAWIGEVVTDIVETWVVYGQVYKATAYNNRHISCEVVKITSSFESSNIITGSHLFFHIKLNTIS